MSARSLAWIRRARRTVLVVLGATLVVGAGMPPAQAVSYGYSGLWSGLLTSGGGYTAVTADVTVPRVSTLCGKDSNVVVFIGLGGWNSLPFVQNGFTVTPNGIGVWWEVFDRAGRGPTSGVPMTIRSGDVMRLSLSFSADRSILMFRWENLTRHVVRTQKVTNAGRYYNGATADYIVERSWFPYRGSPLAAYTPITFSNARAVRARRWVSAYNSGSTKITLLGSGGRTLSRVTSASGTKFTSAWAGCR